MAKLLTGSQRGMTLFVATDLCVFLALFCSYIYLRVQTPQWPAAFHFASGLLAFAMALFAFSGSFAMFYAERYQSRIGNTVVMRLIIATVAVFGCVFLMLAMEWTRLIFLSDVTFTTNPYQVPAFSWTYFALTGFYGFHLLAAMIYLSIVAARIDSSNIGASAIFVHFTNVVWLVILIGVYFASTDLQGL